MLYRAFTKFLNRGGNHTKKFTDKAAFYAIRDSPFGCRPRANMSQRSRAHSLKPGVSATRVKVRPMKKSLLLVAVALGLGISIQPAAAQRPLRDASAGGRQPRSVRAMGDAARPPARQAASAPAQALAGVPNAAVAAHSPAAAAGHHADRGDQPQMYTKREMQRQLDPKFLPQQVAYDGSEEPARSSSIAVGRFLYLVIRKQQGAALWRRRRQGPSWNRRHHKITPQTEWPD